MKKKLLYIDACIRGEQSRTAQLAKSALGVLSERFDITTIDLTNYHLQCITTQEYHLRREQGPSAEDIKHSRLIAEAECIVVAAPFWDMSFPSILKLFIEHTSILNITFCNNADGTTRGNCKAQKLLYITSRGMNIETDSSLDQGTSYLKAICWLWGIPEVVTLAISGTDMCDESTLKEKIENAKNFGIEICKTL